jgi:uncharacterized SAM-binding protein YcdF (DUF218 family)
MSGAATALLLLAGGFLLEASDPLPSHAQVGVVLEGSIRGEVARRDEVMRLLQQGRVDQVILGVANRGYWGQSIPEIARRYFEDTYGPSDAQRVAFCTMPEDVDSTADEAKVLAKCLNQGGWRSAIIVTSNYHTRRARMIWRRVTARSFPALQFWVLGVDDGTFQASGWWHKRLYAKTWFLEVTKLIENYLFES